MSYEEGVSHETELRERAIKHLKKKRDLTGHLLIYTLVNGFLVVIWAMTSGWGSFFWPVFPLVGWGIGVVANIYDVFFGEDFTEEQIRREMEHLDRS